MKGIPVIRTFDKRGGSPSLQTTTTEVRNIYMVYQLMISLVSLLSPPSPPLQPLERRGWRKMPGTYAVRFPRRLMTPLFLKTTLRVK